MKKRTLQIIVTVILSALALFIALRGIDFKSVGESLSQVRWSWLILTILLTLIVMAIRAQRWRMMLGSKISFKDAFGLINIGYLVNNVLPLRAGDAARGAGASLRGDVNVLGALSTVVVERVFDMLAVVLILISTLPLVPNLNAYITEGQATGFLSNSLLLTLSAVASVLILTVFVLIAVFPTKVEDFALTLLTRLRFKEPEKWLKPLRGIIEGLSALGSVKAGLTLVGWTLALWLVTAGTFITALKACQDFIPEQGILPGVVAMWASAFGMVFPATGGIGSFHFAVREALAWGFDVPRTQGFSYAVIIHAVPYFFNLVLGTITLLTWGISLKSLINTHDIPEPERQPHSPEDHVTDAKALNVLIVLTYYRPHTSGLTIYAERLARGLAAKGHNVTILTSRFKRDLPKEETVHGVRVIRVPVLFRISKGVIMPTFGWLAWKYVKEADVISLHLPQFDAAGVALRGRLLKKPTILTYHCDLQLPSGFFNAIVNKVVLLMNDLAGKFSHRVVAYTEDFANHSPFLQRYADKLTVISPPVELPDMTPSGIAAFARMHNPQSKHPVIGMATRMAAEKGVEVLLDAFPKILEKYPDARILYAGQYRNVLAEEAYFNRLIGRIKRYQDEGQWKFLGILDPIQMAAFYPNLDVLVVPSLNSTESFGLVQVESMLCGTPSVASNLPGVRQPVAQTGMGAIAPIGDAEGLATAIIKVLDAPEDHFLPREGVVEKFSTPKTVAEYEVLFQRLMAELN